MYDFNLAIKMYQIQLQNLMTANYLQNFRSNGSNLSTSPDDSFNENKSESESRKRKAGESKSDLGNDEEQELSSYSERSSPDVGRNSKSIKLGSQFKKSSKHTV